MSGGIATAPNKTFAAGWIARVRQRAFRIAPADREPVVLRHSRIYILPTRRGDLPVLLLWADEDPAHPVVGAYEALDLLPNAQLRTLPATGFLMAYDDPVGVARELISFFG